MTVALEKSPFKFLDSYSADDHDIFFGREREVEEVYDKVFQSKLMLVYGASGTGKSSIINCGLANKFDESDWFPIRIRRGGNIRKSLFNQINKEAIQKVSLSDEEKTTNQGLQKVINSVYLDHFKPIYLIFDQFEELFIFGFKDEWSDFISAIRFLMDTNLDLHFIFVIRGEYLEFLSEFEELIPEFFDNRIRVEKMTRMKAEEAIQGPASKYSIQIEEGFEDRLLKKISPDKSQIELTFLQVFLDKIYKMAAKNANGETIEFTNNQIEELGQLGDVLAEFVDEQLFTMEDPKAALTVLKSFVSLQGTKVQNTAAEVTAYCQDLGFSMPETDVEEIIRSFINKRILKDHDDNDKYELRHDSLAQKIFEKITNQEKELLDVRQFLSYSLNEYQKRGTLLSDEDLGYVAFYERNLEMDPDSRAFIDLSKRNSTKRRREKKTRSVIIVLILLLLVTSVVGFFYSQAQKSRAEELAAIAETEKLNAESQKTIAEQQKEIALKNELVANEQAQRANNQKTLADQARNEANAQRNLALEQRNLAEKERLAAVEARKDALVSENLALRQKELAEEQGRIANRLRSLAIAQGIANKSKFISDPELKALLSLQAVRFNNENGGNTFQPDIYSALYDSRQFYFKDENLLHNHSSTISQILETEEGTLFITTDGKLVLLEKAGLKELLSTDYAFESFALLDEEKIAIGSQEGVLLIFDATLGSIVNEQRAHSSDITRVLFYQSTIVTTSIDGNVKFFNQEGDQLSSYELGLQVNDVCEGKEGLWLLFDRSFARLENGDVEFYKLPNAEDFTKIAFNDATNSLLLGSELGDIFTWDIATKQIANTFSGHSAAITDLEVAHEGRFLASSSLDRSVRVWPLSNDFSQPIVLDDHDNWVSDVVFNSRMQVLTATYSGTLKAFELDPSQMVQGLCERVGRNLTAKEWTDFIGEELTYQTTCDE